MDISGCLKDQWTLESTKQCRTKNWLGLFLLYIIHFSTKIHSWEVHIFPLSHQAHCTFLRKEEWSPNFHLMLRKLTQWVLILKFSQSKLTLDYIWIIGVWSLQHTIWKFWIFMHFKNFYTKNELLRDTGGVLSKAKRAQWYIL